MNYLRNWLLALIPLVVVMGVTWLLGLLVVQVKELLPIAYIYTIMVAFQGFFIFLTFIVFSKPVRDVYLKWYKKKDRKHDTLKVGIGNYLLWVATENS